MGLRLISLLLVAGAAFFVATSGGNDDVERIVIDAAPRPTLTLPAPVTTPPAAAASGDARATAAPAATGGWTPVTGNLVGLASECGNVGIASDPAHDLLVAGVAGHGLWSPEPGASRWNALGAAGGVDNHVSHVVVDPDHPDTFWEAGTYGPGGVFRTDDHGRSFRRLGDITHVDHLSVDVSDPERATLLAGGHERADLYLSRDGGRSWDVVGGLPADIGFTAAPLVIDRDTFLVATSNAEGAGIFRTSDGGATWTRVFAGAAWGAPVVRDGAIHWLLQGGGGVVSSTDAGVTWTEAAGRGTISPVAVQLLDMPDGSLVTLGDDHIVRSIDGGATWTPIGPALPYAANHIGYAAGEAVFYVSRFDCSFAAEDDNDVKEDSILRVTVA